MIKFDGWFRRRTLPVPNLTFGVNRYYFRRLKICQWSDKAVWNDSFSFHFVGLTITNIIDLSIWRLRFKQLYMYHVHNDPIFTNRFLCTRNFASASYRYGAISGVRIFAPTKFRQNESYVRFSGCEISTSWQRNFAWLNENSRALWRNFVEISREQRTQNTELRLHFFCTVLWFEHL